MSDVVGYPFLPEFQVQILALLARDSIFLKSNRRIIEPGYFDNPLFAKVSKVIFDYCDNYSVAPSRAVLYEIMNPAENSAEAYLLDSILTLDLSDADYIAERVTRFAKFQAVKRQLKYSEKLLATEQYDVMERGLYESFHAGEIGHDDAHSYFSGISGLLDYLSVENQARITIPSLISEVDEVLDGGIYPGELNVVMGVPGSGKSIWLINMAFGALFSRKNVLYISSEMSRQKVEQRLTSRITGIPTNRIVFHKEDVLKQVNDMGIAMGEMRTQFWPASTASVTDIRNLIEHLNRVDGFKPDLVLIDYLELLIVPGYAESEGSDYARQGLIGKALRGMAAEYDFGLWVATQAKRDSLTKTHLNMGDKADSFKVIQDADVVIGLQRTDENMATHTVNMSFAKLRNSGSSSFVKVLRGNYEIMYIGSAL
jgi:replicative DNA helicase